MSIAEIMKSRHEDLVTDPLTLGLDIEERLHPGCG